MSHKIKSSDFVVRNYRIGDENGIVSLLEHGFDGWSKFDLHCTTLERARTCYQLGMGILKIERGDFLFVVAFQSISISCNCSSSIRARARIR